MGVLLYSVFKSDYGSDFTIEIHDTEFTGTPSEFKTDKQGFTLDYSSETDDIVSPIIGSSCTIGMYVENVNQEFDLISKLKEYQEDRFYVRIYSSEDSRVIDITDTTVSNFNTRVQAAGGTVESTSCLTDDIEALGGAKFYIPSVSSDIYWTGKIVQDLVVLEDEYYPYLYQIQAVDGIGLLANQDYNTAGNKTLFEVFKESIDLIGVDHLYAGTNFYLSTCFNYWDANQTYDVDVDSSTLVRFNTFVYRETNDDGSFTEPKALDILKELCTLFGARIYQRRGAYVLEQYKERADVEYRYFNYDTQGAELTVADKVDDAVIAQTSYEGARLNGGAYNFLPALKRVEVTYNQKRLNNLLANRLTFTGASSPVSLGTLVDDNNAQINLNGNVYYSFIYDGSGTTAPTKFYRSVFRMQLKQEDVNNPGTFYYLKRDFQPTGVGQLYSATSWSTSASYYYFDAGEGKNNASGLNLASSFNIITPPLQVDGNATLDIEFYSLYEHSLSTSAYTAVNAPTNYNDTATINEVTALYLNNGVPGTTVKVFTSTNVNTKVASNLTLDLGEVSVGDSQGLDGSFYIYNGTTWAPSTSWRRGNSGSYISLYKLLTKEVLSFYRKPVERYSGTILAPYTYGTRLKWDSKYYMPTSATYNAGFDEWSGEWFAIDAEETDITVNEPIDLDPVDAGFVGRISGQSGADEIVVATEIVTDNATVSNDVTAGGNVSAVDVTASNDITATGNVTAAKVDSDTVQLLGGSGTQGTMEWNGDENTVELITNGSSHMLGQDMVYNVKNQSGSAIDKGVAVMAVGTLGSSGRILINKASATGDTPARFFLGVTAENIDNGEDGKVIEFGKIGGLDTSAYADGTVLWLDPAVNGGFTATEPTAPNLKIATAFVVHQHATQGVIMVRANQGHKLEDAHDVNITNPVMGDILRWNSDLGYWYNTPFPG